VKVRVILFKPSGKYYIEDDWEIPKLVPAYSSERGFHLRPPMGPYDMIHSPDFWRVDGGPVLVEGVPWGFPHLFPGVPE
jgi:hypothetical protein